MDEAWHHLVALGANQVGALLQRLHREKEAFHRWMPGREEGRRNSEDEQEQGKTSQRLVLPAQAGSIKMHQRVVWSLIIFDFRDKEEKAKKNSQGKDPRTFEENSQGGDHPSIFLETVERWRVERKRKEKKWKKKKKKKKRRNR